jgi:hypothetical protein
MVVVSRNLYGTCSGAAFDPAVVASAWSASTEMTLASEKRLLLMAAVSS